MNLSVTALALRLNIGFGTASRSKETSSIAATGLGSTPVLRAFPQTATVRWSQSRNACASTSSSFPSLANTIFGGIRRCSLLFSPDIPFAKRCPMMTASPRHKTVRASLRRIFTRRTGRVWTSAHRLVLECNGRLAGLRSRRRYVTRVGARIQAWALTRIRQTCCWASPSSPAQLFCSQGDRGIQTRGSPRGHATSHHGYREKEYNHHGEGHGIGRFDTNQHARHDAGQSDCCYHYQQDSSGAQAQALTNYKVENAPRRCAHRQPDADLRGALP